MNIEFENGSSIKVSESKKIKPIRGSTMRRSTIFNYVCDNARFSESSPDKPYFVRFPNPHGGRLFLSDDTNDLVEKIMAFCKTKEGRRVLSDKDLAQYEDRNYIPANDEEFEYQ